jgi:hypothetical protein
LTQSEKQKTNTKKQKMKTKLLILCGTVALAVVTAHAGSLNLSSTAPTPGANDIYNLTGSADDAGNVNDGGTYQNGWLNDGFSYVAGDQTTKGQTFTTGGLVGGYILSDIWLQHAGYTANVNPGNGTYNGTWWRMQGGVATTVRITNPSQVGTGGFALASETCLTPGGTSWADNWYNSDNGDGMWLHITLAAPVTLAANTAYGFDFTSLNNDFFFEWLGTSTDALGGGSAYRGSTVASPDNTLNALVGDRVFLLGLTPVPEPSTLALIGLGGLTILLRRRSA